MNNAGLPSNWKCWILSTDLEPGLITPNAKTIFTRGHCHSLALALKAELGRAATVGGVRWGWGSEGVPSHVVCRVSGHEFPYDVNGTVEVHAPDFKRFPAVSFTDEDWERWGYLLPRVEDALPFAQTLIEKYDLRS